MMLKIVNLRCNECEHIIVDHFIWDKEDPLPYCPECTKNNNEHCKIYRMVETISAPRVIFSPTFFTGMRPENEPWTSSICQYTNDKGERREFDGKRDIKRRGGE